MSRRPQKTFAGSGYDRVSFRLYPGMRHEILNEKGRFRVYHDIAYFSRVKKEDM